MNWATIEAKYQTDSELHWRVCVAAGLVCPFDVFEQLFHDHHGDAAFAANLKAVNWAAVTWEEQPFSGVKLRQVAVPRGYQYAVDEARARTLAHGLTDERPEVIASWRDAGTWVRSPVIVDGDVLTNAYRYELLVGFARFGDLLGLLDRREVRESATHRVWVGQMKS